MKLEKVRENIIFYLTGFLLIVGIKYFYRGAGSDELRWLLAPTTRLVTLFCGIPFVYESNAGYVNHSLRFLIAPSCCGIQFMLITMAVLIFSFIHHIGVENNSSKSQILIPAWGRKLCWMLISIGSSYLFTVLVNALRIILAIYLPVFLENTKLQHLCGTPEQLHTAIGVCVYFTSLLTIYHIAEIVLSKIAPDCHTVPKCGCKCISPVFWYFFIVLGIPFLNRASRQEGGKFGQYALLVTSVCLAVALVAILAAILLKTAHQIIIRIFKI